MQLTVRSQQWTVLPPPLCAIRLLGFDLWLLSSYPALRNNPRRGPNIKRLKNWEPPTWRYRVGDWRFFYEIDDRRRLVFMTAADHRKQAYR